MKDNELRGLVLQEFYNKRREIEFLPSTDDIGSPDGVSKEDILHICDQLGDHNLIEWKPIKALIGLIDGYGKINAFGVDVIEGVQKSPISITLDSSQNFSVSEIHGSTVTFSGNTQANTITLHELISRIDSCKASENEKNEVKGLLQKLLEHPLVSSVVGGLTSLLG